MVSQEDNPIAIKGPVSRNDFNVYAQSGRVYRRQPKHSSDAPTTHNSHVLTVILQYFIP